MAYKKYNSSNNAFAAFNLPIADTDVTCVLKGKYSRFPTSNFIMKATKTVAGVVTARENIYVTTRSGATCTGLVRAYEPVPVDDDATTNIQQALNFSADDIVEVVVSSEFLKDMQEEIDAKLAKSGGLRTGFGANKHVAVNRTSGNEEIKNVTDSAGVVSTDKIRIQKLSGDFEDASMSQIQGAIVGLTSEYIMGGSVNANETVYLSSLNKWRNTTTPLATIGATVATRSFPMYSSGNVEQRYVFYFTKTGTPQDLTFRIETDNAGSPSGTLVNANAVLVTAIASITSDAVYEVVLPASFNLGPAGTPIHFVFWQGSQYVNASNYISIGINDEVCVVHDRVTSPGSNVSATRNIAGGAGTTASGTWSTQMDCVADCQLMSLAFYQAPSVTLFEVFNVTDNVTLYKDPTTQSGVTLREPVKLISGKRYELRYTFSGTLNNVSGFNTLVNTAHLQWVNGTAGGNNITGITTRTATFTPNAGVLSQYISKAIATTSIKAAVYAFTPNGASAGTYPSIKKDGYITGLSGLVKGTTYYLSNSGVISSTAGTVSKVLGVAINTTTIRIDSAINIS